MKCRCRKACRKACLRAEEHLPGNGIVLLATEKESESLPITVGIAQCRRGGLSCQLGNNYWQRDRILVSQDIVGKATRRVYLLAEEQLPGNVAGLCSPASDKVHVEEVAGDGEQQPGNVRILRFRAWAPVVDQLPGNETRPSFLSGIG